MPDDSRTRLRNELLAGAASKPAKPADSRYFANLRLLGKPHKKQ